MHPDHIPLLTTGLYPSLSLCHIQTRLHWQPLGSSHQVTAFHKSINNFIVLLSVSTGLLLYFRKSKREIHLSLPQQLSCRPLTSSNPVWTSIDLYTEHHVMMLWPFLPSSQAVDSYFHFPSPFKSMKRNTDEHWFFFPSHGCASSDNVRSSQIEATHRVTTDFPCC